MATQDRRLRQQLLILLSVILALLLSIRVMSISEAEETPATLGTIHGKVWFDGNHNGIHDQEETTIANHPVFLASTGADRPGAGVVMVHTQDDGSFTFANIEFGTYKISIGDGTAQEVILSNERSKAMVELMFVGWQIFLPSIGR